MANYPDNWLPLEIEIFENVTEGIPAMLENPYVQGLYHDAMFNREISGDMRDEAYNELTQFVHDQYDMDFADEFDWDEWREWYESL